MCARKGWRQVNDRRGMLRVGGGVVRVEGGVELGWRVCGGVRRANWIFKKCNLLGRPVSREVTRIHLLGTFHSAHLRLRLSYVT